MIRRPMLWSIALLAGAAGALAVLPWSPRAPEPQPLALASPPRQAAPRAAPAPARAAVQEARAAAPAGPRPRVEPSPERSDDAEALAMALGYDALLERQRADPSWRSAVVARAEEAFAQAESDGIWLGATSCGESLCRVEVQLQDAAARQAFDAVVSRIPTAMGEAFVHIENEDDLDIEVYVSPDDRPLP